VPAQQLGALRAGELDVAVASLAADPPGLQTRLLIDAPIVAAVPAGHALASRSSLTLDELAAHPLICLPRGTGIRAILDATGVRLRIAFEASDPGMLAMLAARGLGVAILPEPMVGVLRALDLGLSGKISLCWRAGGPSSPAARALVGSVS
jgi:DNA-binding transcriptional LysR family regulator